MAPDPSPDLKSAAGGSPSERLSAGSLRERAVLDQASLPPRVRELLERVMDTSELRREDRLEVLRELATHFQDGLDAGRTPEDLVRSFGDGGWVGKRIGEARRRRRWLPEPRRGVGSGLGEAFSNLVQDLRVALRGLSRSPTFALVTILTLSLGIGATTAVFSVVNGVMLRPLPYPQPERLAALWMTDEEDGDLGVPWSVQSLRDVVQENGSFEAISGWQWEDETLTGMGDPTLVYAVGVSSGLLTTLGVRPLLGRDIQMNEAEPDGPAVVVLSFGFWQDRFGGDEGVLGRTITLSGRPHEIIGVAPQGFAYPSRATLWIPGRWGEDTHPRDRHFLLGVGRLAPGVSLEVAQTELSGIAARMEEAYPEANRDRGIHLVPLMEETVGEVRLAMLVLLGAVAMVLFIACANVANLFLVRGAARVREVAVRATLGASRRAILRLLLAESMVFALAGGGMGVLMAIGGVKGVKALSPGDIPRLGEAAVDGTALIFAGALVAFVALLTGLFPAVRLARTPIAAVIREGRDERLRLGEHGLTRSGLLTLEVALSLMLLFGAGLLLRSFDQIRRVDVGFDAKSVLQFTLTLPSARYDEDAVVGFQPTLQERLASLPGVESVGMINGSPLGRSHTTIGFGIVGRQNPPSGHEPNLLVRRAGPGYFRTLRIPLLRGRAFEAADRAGAPMVAVISNTAARRYWPGEDPIGKQFSFDPENPDERVWTIVGVVGDVRSLDLTSGAWPEAYFPLTQWPRNTVTVVLRAESDPSSLVTAIRREVGTLDSQLPIYYVERLQDRMDRYLGSDRFYLFLLSIFACLAVTLAAVGLYGVVAYLVSRRTREIGIRVALGAGRGEVLGLVLRQSLGPVLLGGLVGVGAALASGRVLAGLLYRVRPWDPLTYVVGTALFMGVAFLATISPARSATRISPTEAMRAE